MSSIKIKSFLGAKGGVSTHDGADRMAMNLEQGRFAVADGVSRSYQPGVWADILCEAFVKSHAKADENWIEQYAVSQMTSDCHSWAQQSEAFLNNGTEDDKFWLQIIRDKYHYAGATLVGIVFADKLLHYNVLGDSCLFLLNKETGELNSYSTIKEQEGFTNHPDFLWSAGNVVGKSKYGQLALSPGYVLLATDKISEWIIKRYAKDHHLIDYLWSLDSHEAFMSLVEESRKDNSMDDDDVALMIFQIESEVVEGFELLFCDEMVSLVGQETTTPPLELSPSEHISDDSDTAADEAIHGDFSISQPVNDNNIPVQETHEDEDTYSEVNELEQKEEASDNLSHELSSPEVEVMDSDVQALNDNSNSENNTKVEVLSDQNEDPALESRGKLEKKDNRSSYERARIKIRWMLRKAKRFFCSNKSLTTSMSKE